MGRTVREIPFQLSDLSGQKRLPIVGDGFARAVEDCVVVDKTMLIADLLDSGNLVTLFCRPRRFGKTFNMSMLQAFFESIPTAASRANGGARAQNLFENFAIWNARDGFYRKHYGAYPVIFVSLSTIKKQTWPEAYAAIEELIAAEYSRHAYLLESGALNDLQKAYFQRVANRQGDTADLSASLARLASFLYAHHKQRVVLLLDEYDAPVMTGYSAVPSYYGDVVSFMKGWLTGALKDAGASLAFACLTGVQRISKESVFSDLNNLVVSTPLTSQFDEYFGFTEKEVSALARYLGREDGLETARTWYDGYRFGSADIYNPWSVLNYFANDCAPGTYWANTSGNSVIGDALLHSDEATMTGLYQIMEPDETVSALLNLEVVFPDVGARGDALWGMLYLSGYVTTDETALPNMRGIVRRLRLPNMEVAALFRDEVVDRFSRTAGGERGLDALHDALFTGNAAAVERELGRILREVASFNDLTSENSYHMLLLGLCFGVNGYLNPVSNREEGAGRYGIRLEPAAPDSPFAALTLSMPSRPPLITIELKYAKGGAGLVPEEVLRSLADAALAQIADKGYDSGEMPASAYSRVRFGVAFSGKSVAVVSECLA